mgnify:CR=1 FL=1
MNKVRPTNKKLMNYQTMAIILRHTGECLLWGCFCMDVYAFFSVFVKVLRLTCIDPFSGHKQQQEIQQLLNWDAKKCFDNDTICERDNNSATDERYTDRELALVSVPRFNTFNTHAQRSGKCHKHFLYGIR